MAVPDQFDRELFEGAIRRSFERGTVWTQAANTRYEARLRNAPATKVNVFVNTTLFNVTKRAAAGTIASWEWPVIQEVSSDSVQFGFDSNYFIQHGLTEEDLNDLALDPTGVMLTETAREQALAQAKKFNEDAYALFDDLNLSAVNQVWGQNSSAQRQSKIYGAAGNYLSPNAKITGDDDLLIDTFDAVELELTNLLKLGADSVSPFEWAAYMHPTVKKAFERWLRGKGERFVERDLQGFGPSTIFGEFRIVESTQCTRRQFQTAGGNAGDVGGTNTPKQHWPIYFVAASAVTRASRFRDAYVQEPREVEGHYIYRARMLIQTGYKIIDPRGVHRVGIRAEA